MIREAFMDAGTWEVALSGDTPKGILDLIDVEMNPEIGYAQFCVTPAPFTTGRIPTELPSVSMYGGPYLRKQRNDDRTWTLSGMGMLGYLGSENDTEPCQTVLLDDTSGADAKTATNWANKIIEGGTITASPLRTFDPSVLRTGTITAPSSNTSDDYGITTSAEAIRLPRRAFMEWIVTNWDDFEYLANPDGTVDWGPHATLYPATPVFIDTSAGLDGSNPGIHAATVSTSKDLEDWASTIYTVPSDGLFYSSAGTTPFYGPFGDSLAMAVVVHTGFPPTWATRRAAQILASRNSTHRTVSITVDSTSINYLDGTSANPAGQLRPGHDVWVYDPFHGLVGGTAHRHRGRHVFPLQVRLQSVEWPVTSDLGVYLRWWDSGGDVHAVDLSPYLIPEDTQVTVEVGDPRRRVLQPRPPLLYRF